MSPRTVGPLVTVAVAGSLLGSAMLPAGSGRAAVGPEDRTAVARLAPAADAYVRADRSRGNFGRARHLRVGGAGRARSYLTFRVPAEAGVDRAVLRVYSRGRSRQGLRVRAVKDKVWREQQLSSRSAPRPLRAASSSGPLKRGWAGIDVTSIVRGRDRVTLALTGTSRRALVLFSREARGRAPRLVLYRAGAGTTPAAPGGSAPAGATNPSTPVESPTPTATPAPGEMRLAAAGDIAYGGSEDEDTAKLLDALDPTAVAALGDLAYDSGTLAEFKKYYEPTWGRHKAKTYPTPGNHEYKTSGAAGYFDYFGAAAGERGKGYYSYDLGEAWHVVVLNTNGSDACQTLPCAAGSMQEQWLRADLAATDARCVLAYWHHPRFSTGPHGDNPEVTPLYQALYEHRAELVLAGHDHSYQRWAPMRPDGQVDTARGLRSFVVGTGGKNAYAVGDRANLEVKQTGTPGVLELTLTSSGYDWRFVPVAGKTFTDSGSGTCH